MMTRGPGDPDWKNDPNDPLTRRPSDPVPSLRCTRWWWWWWWYGSCCLRNLKAKAITRRWDDSQYALCSAKQFNFQASEELRNSECCWVANSSRQRVPQLHWPETAKLHHISTSSVLSSLLLELMFINFHSSLAPSTIGILLRPRSDLNFH